MEKDKGKGERPGRVGLDVTDEDEEDTRDEAEMIQEEVRVKYKEKMGVPQEMVNAGEFGNNGPNGNDGKDKEDFVSDMEKCESITEMMVEVRGTQMDGIGKNGNEGMERVVSVAELRLAVKTIEGVMKVMNTDLGTVSDHEALRRVYLNAYEEARDAWDTLGKYYRR